MQLIPIHIDVALNQMAKFSTALDSVFDCPLNVIEFMPRGKFKSPSILQAKFENFSDKRSKSVKLVSVWHICKNNAHGLLIYFM